jgi:hypothetical protein
VLRNAEFLFRIHLRSVQAAGHSLAGPVFSSPAFALGALSIRMRSIAMHGKDGKAEAGSKFNECDRERAEREVNVILLC